MSLSRDRPFRASLFAPTSVSADTGRGAEVDIDDIDRSVQTQRARLTTDEPGARMAEARASAQRSLQLLDNSFAVGVETLAELDRQGDQLRHAKRRLDEVDDHMRESDRLLRGMGSWLGALYNKLAPDSSSSSSSSMTTSWGWLPSWQAPSTSVETAQGPAPPSLLVDGEAKRFWTETDAYLDQMNERVERLHALGTDMAGQLEKQAHEIEELDVQVRSTTEAIRNRTLKIFRLT